MQAWVNGAFVPLTEAKVSLFDSGFQHAIGLFETMHARHGRVFRLMEHLRRLRESAISLRLMERLEIGPLARAVESVVESSALERARVRLTITGGEMMLAPGSTARSQVRHDPTIAIVPQAATIFPDAIYDEGVRVCVAESRTNQLDAFVGHKTLWYWPRLAELQRAGNLGCSESLWFSVTNRLSSGSVSNVFVVKQGAIHTPQARGESERSSALPGVTRGAVMEVARARGIEVHCSATLTIDDVLGADEMFLTNSSWGVLPVTRVEAGTIGSGSVGPIARDLRAAYEALVESETTSSAEVQGVDPDDPDDPGAGR
jgi:branched-subunit amino acid aminotransferase/4-amino-4-deoxychorismate lyase